MSRGATSPLSGSGLRFVAEEDRRTIFGPGLQLTFSRVGDRWLHELKVGSPDALTEVASSVEGDPARDDPARVVSPAYQDVQEHPFDGGVRLLLTGQSTPHHSSAVVTVRPDGDGVRIEFDVADRCRAPVAALAATYLVPLGSGDLIGAGPERIIWGGNVLARGRLEFVPDALGTVSLAEAGRRGARVQALARIVSSTATHRLVYHWHWTPASAHPTILPSPLPEGGSRGVPDRTDDGKNAPPPTPP